MFDIETVKEALYAWAAGVDAVATVIWAKPNAPAPNFPYTSLFIDSITQVAEDYVGKVDINGISAISGNREIMLEVQTYGILALSRIEALRSSLARVSVQDALSGAGIACIEAMHVRDASVLDVTLFEPRGLFEARFRVAHSDEDDLGVIEKVEGAGTYFDANGEVVLVEPISISAF